MKKNNLKEKIILFIKESLDTILFVIVMLIAIKFFIGEIRWIPSGSMHPTLLEGDRVFVERYSRFYRQPKRGDILIFYPPMVNLKTRPDKVFARITGFLCKDMAFIKRVIGMPGDKIEIKKNADGSSVVLVNDKELNEKYIQSKYEYNDCTPNMYCGPFVVPDGSYFMMGDNRGNSQDSRYWGFLPQERIIGRAVFLMWPFNRTKAFKRPKYSF